MRGGRGTGTKGGVLEEGGALEERWRCCVRGGRGTEREMEVVC